ncbi:hypothetical protein D3H55_04455 [Bacillus salacetis]|uniref:Uncharacterized protein n=1 Tax=Bacillus salacetis TaxID=2315464 RepID=A0A3A1R5C1_9BACI|nr:hypothetical protein [Bacillus salacetis]RIW37296.1 hypothetical protein D3H55_04455 [Bacillus salacetis]
MEKINIRKLRLRQLLLLNGLCLSGFTIFFLVINTSGLSLKWLFTIIPVLMLLQTGEKFLRRNSSRILIPIIDEVTQYEKQKMGAEWIKQQRVAAIINLFAASLMFL